MKAHLTIPAAAFSTLLAAALATGNPLLYLLAILSLLSAIGGIRETVTVQHTPMLIVRESCGGKQANME